METMFLGVNLNHNVYWYVGWNIERFSGNDFASPDGASFTTSRTLMIKAYEGIPSLSKP